MNPMVERMDPIITKIVYNLEGNHFVKTYDRATMVNLKEALMRLRAGYCTLPGAPSWYILQGCGRTSLSELTAVLDPAERFVNKHVMYNGLGAHDQYAVDDLVTRIEKMCPRHEDNKPVTSEDKEQAIFTATLKAVVISVGASVSKLLELLENDGNMPTTTKVELKSMADQLGYLQNRFLRVGDVPFKKLRVRGPNIFWLSQTSKLFYDAENLVDTLVVPAKCSDPAANLEGIKNITERASFQMQLLSSCMKGSRIRRAAYEHEQETELVGLDGPRDELIKMLAEEDGMPAEKNMKGVIITGEEGSGKTTLARVMYHHLKPQFDCAAFVTASMFSGDAPQQLSKKMASMFSDDAPQQFFKEMASQLDPSGSIELIAEQIAEFLQNKRYLVVIDDVCSGSAWGDSIFPSFPNNEYGSRVIAICQTYDMCDIRWKFSNKSVYELQPLGHPDSEKLFLKHLVGREASCPNASTNVIKEIVRMCGHNPSAIIRVASVFASKVTTTKPWQEVMDSVYSDWKQMAISDYIPDFEDSRYILSLIYMHLPRPLNTCLLHLAVQAKNQMICRTAMSNKWVAEGFFGSSRCHSEKRASMCFDALIRRNLIQLVEYDKYLGEEIYEVNYMMHNVLRKLARNSSFADVFSGQGSIAMSDMKSERLLIQYSGSELSIQLTELPMSDISYHSITIVGPVKVYFNSYLAHLLVLDVDGCKELDNSAMNRICRMIKLRYLSIKHTQVTQITPEIRKLGCLETLDIRHTQISNLPPEIGTLRKLKILDARQTLISCLPREIGELQNLETLDVRQTLISCLPLEIRTLQKLKILDARQTLISCLPREIGELQNLEILDVRQTLISNLPPEIRTLQKLRILDARQTLITCLPREIGELQNLETLDVRQTQVEELPEEIVQLPILGHLYFGQINSLQGVKLPVGSDQLNSVKVFGTVDSREWSGSAMDEICGLTGVRKLEVVLHDQLADKDQNDKLLSSIGKCEKLEFLIIHGDYNPSDKLPVSSFCPLLERLKVAGRFVKVPRWLAQLTTLKQLYVRVCKLDRDDLEILGGLPVLSTLALSLISILRKKRVTISRRLHSSTCTDLHPLEETCPAGFTSLEVFNFDCHVPWITFEQGAMPRLTHLHLKLFPCPADKFPAGIINLPSLEKIILRYSSYHASSRGVTNAVASMREEASSHANLIDISINGDHEVFPSITRVDEAVTGTKIEEDSEHDNQMELSVNGNHEVLDSRVNETLTGTETEEASKHGSRIELPVDGDREVLLSNTRVDETIAGTEIKECY